MDSVNLIQAWQYFRFAFVQIPRETEHFTHFKKSDLEVDLTLPVYKMHTNHLFCLC